MRILNFHELAEKELVSARDFYDDLVFGLGKKFVLDIEHSLKNVIQNPFAFPVYFKDFRKALLRKFPYSIIYKVGEESILILAIAHQKRKPKYWAERII